MEKTLEEKLQEAVDSWILSVEDMNSINYTALTANPDISTTHIDELNKSWDEYQKIAEDTAAKLADAAKEEAEKLAAIEKAANDIKIERSDETRENLEDITQDYKDTQDTRYDDVKDITAKQEAIANREANMAVAKAGQYGDIFSDWAMLNIKNDVMGKYWENILNAEQYALSTNRTIDTDLLNLWLKEIADEDARNEFKDVLLDKENSYMLAAVKEAAEGDKKALTDVETFYQTYIKLQATEEYSRSAHTDRRDDMQSEYETSDIETKAALLRDLSYETPWYSLVVDRIPGLIDTYPNMTLSELQWKVAKIGELALTAKQQIPAILAIDPDKRTQAQKDVLDTYFTRWLEEQERSDMSTPDTQALIDKNNGIEDTNTSTTNTNSNISYANPEPSDADKQKQIDDAANRAAIDAANKAATDAANLDAAKQANIDAAKAALKPTIDRINDLLSSWSITQSQADDYKEQAAEIVREKYNL